MNVRTRLEVEHGEGSWFTWADRFENFKQAMDFGYKLLKEGRYSRIEILQPDRRSKWVSAGIFNLEEAARWYRELDEAKEREKWR